MHTPGPWSLEPAWADRADWAVAIVNRDHMRDDWDVCSVHSTEANARLIAAAPDLLNALTVLADAAESRGIPADAARAAIARATQP